MGIDKGRKRAKRGSVIGDRCQAYYDDSGRGGRAGIVMASNPVVKEKLVGVSNKCLYANKYV